MLVIIVRDSVTLFTLVSTLWGLALAGTLGPGATNMVLTRGNLVRAATFVSSILA